MAMSTAGRSPMATLPTELLAGIFGHAAQDAHEIYIRSLKHELLPADPRLPRPYCWIRITHVCSLWRAIALSTPALWTNISLIDTDPTYKILQRTRSLNITVTFRLPAKSPAPGGLPWEQVDKRMHLYSWLLLAETRRITAVTAPAMLGDFSSDVVGEATQLRSLVILAPDLGRISSAPGAYAFPALEHLEYRAAGSISPVPLLCATLRTLVVQPMWENAVDPYTAYMLGVRKLVRALRGMPRLEALDVSIADSRNVPPVPEIKHEPVPAARLHTVRLIGVAPACAHFLQHVALPPDARLDIESVVRNIQPDMAPRPVPHAIAAVLQGPPSTLSAPCAAFSIESADGGGYVLRGWRRADARYAAGAADVVLRCGMRKADADLVVLLRVFALHGVEHVRIVCRHLGLFGPYAGFDQLARGARLRSIVLDGVKADLAVYLLPTTTAADVALENVKFKPSGPEDAKQWEDERAPRPEAIVPERPNTMRELAQLLAASTAEERAIRRLKLTRVQNVRAEDVEGLREHVAEVNWDRVESMNLTYDRN
ncbi:hypothetical protein PsYK624_148480 [Phanerochaete sordida]|uniref:F-box domain-containing protein n=1 Tax=Phanerochaete sordida TaxID=48140 RepID=A0A9P3GSJ8_9APHY|nr:hypothetical protein PsYK624_148480 [Phanerochaete sordida]